MLSTAKAMGLQVPVTLQQQYNLACREIEYEVVPAALHNGIGLLPGSPLAAGSLTGKCKREAEPTSGRLSRGRPDEQAYRQQLPAFRSQLADPRCGQGDSRS